MIYIGVDPGMTGAISFIENNELIIYPFKKTEKFHFPEKIRDALNLLTKAPYIIYIEKVHSMPGQGVASVFTFGRMVGIIQGMLKQADLIYTEVTPQDWQRKLAIGLVSKDKSLRKKEYQCIAQRLFPNTEVKLDVADSVLIAYYAKVMNEEI